MLVSSYGSGILIVNIRFFEPYPEAGNVEYPYQEVVRAV